MPIASGLQWFNKSAVNIQCAVRYAWLTDADVDLTRTTEVRFYRSSATACWTSSSWRHRRHNAEMFGCFVLTTWRPSFGLNEVDTERDKFIRVSAVSHLLERPAVPCIAGYYCRGSKLLCIGIDVVGSRLRTLRMHALQ